MRDLCDLAAVEGVEAFGFHDLRRSYRSGLAKLGVSPEICEMLLNHASRNELVEVYDRYEYQLERREAVERWASHITGLIGGGETVVALRN